MEAVKPIFTGNGRELEKASCCNDNGVFWLWLPSLYKERGEATSQLNESRQQESSHV
jgi:hypothetical protein